MARHVLIAEDEGAIARLVEANLVKHGYEVTIARDGREAMQRIDAEKFDAFVLDLIMPYWDGVEVLRHLRRQEATRQAPVVILATCPPSEADELIAAYEYTPTKYLQKPFDPVTLLATLDAALKPLPEG